MRQLPDLPRPSKLKTVELRRPDSSHSWGICYAVLPGGPEILKVLTESPAYGHCQAGQVLKRINGQIVNNLRREEINEILNIDEEVVILELAEATSLEIKPLAFARDYGRGSVEPGMFQCRRNSDSRPPSTLRRGSNCCVEMPSNLPNCRDEFQRIHEQRRASRQNTINQLETIRMQRAASVDQFALPPQTPITPSTSAATEADEPHRSSLNRPDLPLKSLEPQTQASNIQQQALSPLAELPTPYSTAKDIRYMGVQIPSRSFRALATLMGMDPSGSDISGQSTQASSKEPCRTVIDVRGTAETMRRNSLQRPSIGNGSSDSPVVPY